MRYISKGQHVIDTTSDTPVLKTIALGLVLENEKIKEALRKRDDALVLKLLDEEF